MERPTARQRKKAAQSAEKEEVEYLDEDDQQELIDALKKENTHTNLLFRITVVFVGLLFTGGYYHIVHSKKNYGHPANAVFFSFALESGSLELSIFLNLWVVLLILLRIFQEHKHWNEILQICRGKGPTAKPAGDAEEVETSAGRSLRYISVGMRLGLALAVINSGYFFLKHTLPGLGGFSTLGETVFYLLLSFGTLWTYVCAYYMEFTIRVCDAELRALSGLKYKFKSI
eukprot:Nk52_evm100s485 gene=Nk52_evmTU100s485